MKKNKFINLKIISIIFYIISIISMFIGFYKMFVYYNPEYYGDKINVYVGGDAYNYIINSNYSNGYYILSMGFLLAGSIFLCTYLILNELNFKINN